MKVAILSRTPLAAAPWELFKALRKYTLVDVSLINARNSYPDGRHFPYDILADYENSPRVMKAVRDAELWHVHNYPWNFGGIRDGHKVMAQFHSLPRLGQWKALADTADRCYTIRQPLQMEEYKPWPALPNIIDPDEYLPIRRAARPVIAFAPSSKAPVGFLCSKGYAEVKVVLNSIARKRDVEVTLIEHMSYEANLAMKQRAHILIDDVVTGNWHRTSLEGACFGCAVLNQCNQVPFVFATLKTLEERLLWLIDNPGTLAAVQEQTRLWVLEKWHAIDAVQEYVAAYREVLSP